MSDDRELLGSAANAMQNLRNPSFANYEVVGGEPGVCLELGSRRGAITSYWNPLRDSGSALRLSVDLQIDVKHYGDHVVAWYEGGFIGTGRIPYDGDPCAATRRAIVRAAAEIGRTMT